MNMTTIFDYDETTQKISATKFIGSQITGSAGRIFHTSHSQNKKYVIHQPCKYETGFMN